MSNFPSHTKECNPPDMLRLRKDGTLYCKDGTDVTTYLKTYAANFKAKEEIPVCVFHREGIKTLWEDAWLGRNHAS